MVTKANIGSLSVVVPAALDTNEGLAEVQAGRPAAGLPLLERALGTDPGNAILLQNVAYAQRRLGRTTLAVADYRRAVASDPTNYPAANDLGVLLADQGHAAAAVAALRIAVGAGPDYPLARFNLGVVLDRQGVTHALESEGDRAQAIRMDPGLADNAPVPQFDNGTVITELDLARPPPPGWHFTVVERVSPGAAAGLALLVLLVGLGRELAQGKAADKAEERLLERADESASESRHRWMRRRTTAVVATIATVAVLTWPLASSTGATWEGDALLAGAVLVLVAVYVRIHLVVSRPAGTPLRHHTSVSPLGIAALAVFAHLAFAPLPVAEAHEESHRHRRWMAPLVIGVSGVGLLAIGRLTEVPSARAFGAAALVITSSALLPIAPSDGAYLGGRLPAMAASGALLIVSSLLFLGVL
jgi:cellulose synthase operon protein C